MLDKRLDYYRSRRLNPDDMGDARILGCSEGVEDALDIISAAASLACARRSLLHLAVVKDVVADGLTGADRERAHGYADGCNHAIMAIDEHLRRSRRT